MILSIKIIDKIFKSSYFFFTQAECGSSFPQVVGSLFLSPGGPKFIHLMYHFARFVAIKYIETHSKSKLSLQQEFFLVLILKFFFFFVFSFFLGPYPWHMEVPRLGVELELQLPAYTTATATLDLSHNCNLHHSSWQCWMLNPPSKARDCT